MIHPHLPRTVTIRKYAWMGRTANVGLEQRELQINEISRLLNKLNDIWIFCAQMGKTIGVVMGLERPSKLLDGLKMTCCQNQKHTFWICSEIFISKTGVGISSYAAILGMGGSDLRDESGGGE